MAAQNAYRPYALLQVPIVGLTRVANRDDRNAIKVD
jgi:hypothetical protein